MMKTMMKVSLLVSLILLSFSGFSASSTLPDSTVQVRVGDNVTLQCPLLAYNTTPSTANYTSPFIFSMLSWYRRTEGHRPQLILSFRPNNPTDVRYGFGVHPEKVAALSDGSLLLRGSQQSDSAVYYCGISTGQEIKKTTEE